jgi:hypothetical protein
MKPAQREVMGATRQTGGEREAYIAVCKHTEVQLTGWRRGVPFRADERETIVNDEVVPDVSLRCVRPWRGPSTSAAFEQHLAAALPTHRPNRSSSLVNCYLEHRNRFL